jgi:hypothetical protein
MSNREPWTCEMMCDGTGIYVVIDGVKIAKRGDPRTPQAKTWVSLEPGWRVFDNADLTEIVVEHDGVRVQ